MSVRFHGLSAFPLEEAQAKLAELDDLPAATP